MVGVTERVAIPVRTDTEPTHVSMQLDTPLPAVCTRHGRPAVEFRTKFVPFHWHKRARVQSTLSSVMRHFLTRPRAMPPQTAMELHGEWPVCARCTRQQRWLRVVGVTLILAGVLPLAAIAIAGYLSIITTPPRSLALAFIPGWFPGAVMVATAAFERASRYVVVQPNDNDSSITVRAHPRFAEAAAAQGFSQAG